MKITANQVTFGRLILMPCLCAGLYASPTIQLVTIALGAILATTDFLDGYLARKYGPTVLGGLMDPIADKVFIAVTFLPYVDRGLAPWWAIAALFLREFVVTAIRSSFEIRQRTLKTSYLAKLKTWVQMASIFVLLLVPVVSRRTSLTLFLIATGGALVAWAIAALRFRRRWSGVMIFLAFFIIGAAVFAFAGTRVFEIALLAVVLAFTWASGLDYIVAGVRQFVGARAVKSFDAVRFVGAAVLPVVAIYALARGAAPAWTVIPIMAMELAHGGLDNLLAHHGAAASAATWGGRLLAVCGLLVVAIAWPAAATPAAAAALVVDALATTAEFWRGRRHYVDAILLPDSARPASPCTDSRLPS